MVRIARPTTNGFKFVRQYPVGPYFADFACREKYLVVELDGSQHLKNARDLRRDAFMNGEGWSVVRFWNVDALTAMSSVLETIVAICDGRLTDTVEAPDLRFFPARNKR
jgi:very-short-patch-repair endonuclease